MCLNKFNSRKISRITLLFSGIISLFILVYSFQRDWKLDEIRVPIDLRNRIIGARLLETNHSPYLYQWQDGDPVELYDFARFRETKISAVSATPFFLFIYSTFKNLSFFTISKTCLILEYLLILFLITFTYYNTKNSVSKILVPVIISLVTLSNQWQCHTDSGQYYIFFCFLFLSFYLVTKKIINENIKLILQILIALVLIFTRPLTVVFLIPLILIYPPLKRFIIYTAISTFLAIILIFLIPKQQHLWKDYFTSVNYMSDFYQGKIKPNFNFKEYTEPCNVEGFNIEKMDNNPYKKNYREYYFNYYKLPEEFGLKRLSIITCFFHYCILGIIGLIFINRKIKKSNDFESKLKITLLYGFLLYMLAEIFLPIQRASYNEVQWLFPISIMFLIDDKKNILILSFLFFIFLSIFNFKNFDLQVIFSEVIALIGLATYLLMPNYNANSLIMNKK